MNKFVPVEKMSKKAKKELARSRRKCWDVVPVSRRVENKKRDALGKKGFHDRYDDGMGSFFMRFFVRSRRIGTFLGVI